MLMKLKQKKNKNYLDKKLTTTYALSAGTKIVAIAGWWLLAETGCMEFSAQRFQQKNYFLEVSGLFY